MRVKQYVRDRVFSMLPNPNCTAGYPYTVSGNPCTVENPSITPLRKFQVLGNSTQQTYSGKNLLPPSDIESKVTGRGITFTNNGDGTYTLEGNCTEVIYFWLGKVTLDEGTYVLSGCPAGGSTNGYRMEIEWGLDVLEETGNGLPITVDAGAQTFFDLYIAIGDGTAAPNLVFRPQLERGTVKTDFEPYVGGIPFPNPESPMAVESAGDKSRNLIDYYAVEAWELLPLNAGDPASRQVYKYPLNDVLEVGKTYTFLIGEGENFTHTLMLESLAEGAASSTYKYIAPGVLQPYTFTVQENTSYWITPDAATPEILESRYLVLKNAQLEEGTAATPYIPKDQYRVPVTVRGKNLFDKDAAVIIDHSYIDNAGNIYESIRLCRTNMYIPVRPNTTYTLTGCGGPQNNTGAYLWDANKNFICRMVGLHQNKVVFTTTDQCYYVDLQLLSSEYGENQYDIDALQLEESPVATSYEPYFKETVNLYLDAPLRKVGDAADTVDWENGKVIRAVGKAVYDETESFTVVSGDFWFTEGVTTAFDHTIPADALPDVFGMPCMCNLLQYRKASAINKAAPYISGNIGKIIFAFLNTTASNIEELKAFLADNPMEFIYALAQPTETAITLPALPFHPHRTHIFTVDTEVPGEIALAYHSFDHKEA